MIILFDLDDTLIDQRNASNIASQIFLHKYQNQLPYTESTFPQIWWEVMLKYSKLFNEGKILFQDQRRLRIREIFNQSEISDQEADLRFNVYLENLECNWRIFDDAIPCLESLDYYQLGIVTNGNSVQQRQKLDKFDLKKYFKQILISEELGISKPDKKIFLAASSKFACNPAQCIFVGDSMEQDIIGSNEVGMRGIWLNRDKRKCDDVSIETVHSLNDLKTKIEGSESKGV